MSSIRPTDTTGSTAEAVPVPTTGQLVARQLDYWGRVYLRTWHGTLASSFLMPLLYVVAIGVLLGGYIDSDPAQLEGASSYLAFVVPGMIAGQVMTVGVSETSWPVMSGIKWQKVYVGQIATPLTVPSIVLAQLAFVGFRLFVAVAVFLLVLAPFGVLATWWGALLAVPVLILVGLAFAAVCFGFTAGLDSDTTLTVIYRLAILPMFLFSGAFFPVSQLPTALEWAAKATPLWHGVSLTRMLTTDTLAGGQALVHLVYLGALAAFGTWWAVRRLTAKLVV
ncbi:ABC transporter permease [Nocardioides massiliensis]|uniref:Transport permease protein n=1 Tax=Nocardioides massiliensis TaxID=1325935 RepID=A0ABT9NQH3_9ACTN|nr:ABC transporter permease [Nocardioides massiliensis]MDP9822682.1 lipooligosaccharide transport system permease protein [Nocardioides massiliensis]